MSALIPGFGGTPRVARGPVTLYLMCWSIACARGPRQGLPRAMRLAASRRAHRAGHVRARIRQRAHAREVFAAAEAELDEGLGVLDNAELARRRAHPFKRTAELGRHPSSGWTRDERSSALTLRRSSPQTDGGEAAHRQELREIECAEPRARAAAAAPVRADSDVTEEEPWDPPRCPSRRAISISSSTPTPPPPHPPPPLPPPPPLAPRFRRPLLENVLQDQLEAVPPRAPQDEALRGQARVPDAPGRRRVAASRVSFRGPSTDPPWASSRTGTVTGSTRRGRRRNSRGPRRWAP